MTNNDEETQSNASLIAASRNTMPALLDLIEEMAGALNEIATSKHRAYTDGPYISEHDSGYKMGVADGHRYCANVAGKALAAYEKMKGE